MNKNDETSLAYVDIPWREGWLCPFCNKVWNPDKEYCNCRNTASVTITAKADPVETWTATKKSGEAYTYTVSDYR